jgi:hypothetical protein
MSERGAKAQAWVGFAVRFVCAAVISAFVGILAA